jgi:hypothetical protein
MLVTDLFEAEIIQFPSHSIKPKAEPAPRTSEVNRSVIDELRQQIKQSIIRQKQYALPTIMRDQPKHIKPVTAWAIALDEVSHLAKKDHIQQWIFDTGKEIVDDLLKLVREDIKGYKKLYDIKMEPWETGKTSAVIYKHKQIDRNTEDLLEKFKSENSL